MVGVRKIVLDLETLLTLECATCGVKTVRWPFLEDLLNQYNIVEICGEGSPEHRKAGLSKEKVLVRAYSKRQGDNKNE